VEWGAKVATQAATKPQPAFLVQYANYLEGHPEIYITSPDGIGVVLPAEYLDMLQVALTVLKYASEDCALGQSVFVDVAEDGNMALSGGK
jgi:hypothetical protein